MIDKADIFYTPETIPPEREGALLMLCPVPAGFPSPAEDYVEKTLDLHRYAVRNEAATFFLRASGDSMLGAGIHDGDILVVDRSVQAVPGKVVIAIIEGELTVKRFIQKQGRLLLAPENSSYKALDVTENENASIWGVVTFVLHQL